MITTQQYYQIGAQPFSWLDRIVIPQTNEESKDITNIAGLYSINFNNAWCGDTQTIEEMKLT